jgi:hypothetical protein
LMARMASPLSGMATSDHSCSGDAPLGFGSTVTIFHPVVMDLRLTSSLMPAHPTTSTRRPNSVYRSSPPGASASRSSGSPLAATSQDRSGNKDRNPPGGAHLVFRVRRIRRNGKLPEPRPFSLAVLNAHQWTLKDCTRSFSRYVLRRSPAALITQGRCLRLSASNACRIGRARPFSPFGDVDLASKSYEIQPAMARLIERGPAAQYVAQRSLLVSKCTPGAKDADHTVIPVAALAGCRGPGGTGK